MGLNKKGKELGVGFSQRKDGLYCARFTVEKGKRVSLYSKSLTELRKMKDEYLMGYNQKKQERNKKCSERTLNEIFDEYIENEAPLKLKRNTAVIYRQCYNNHIRESIGKQPISSISAKDLMAFFQKLTWLSLSYLSSISAVLKNVFQYAIVNEYITGNNPAQYVTPRSELIPKKKDALTPEQESAFIRACFDVFLGPVFLFMLMTGLRISECMGLRFSDVQYAPDGTLYVEISHQLLRDRNKKDECFYETPKSKSGKRKVPLNKTAELILRRQLYTRVRLIPANICVKNTKPYKTLEGFDDLIFTTRRGRPLRTSLCNTVLYEIVARMNQENGSEIFPQFSTHILRHTFITRLYTATENRLSIEAIEGVVGHKRNITVDVYVTEKMPDLSGAEEFDKNVIEDLRRWCKNGVPDNEEIKKLCKDGIKLSHTQK